MKNVIILALCGLLVACAQNEKSAKLQKDVDTYKSAAEKLIKNNEAKKGSKTLRQDALELINLANPIFTQFKAKYPKCSNVLDHIEKAATKMTTLSLAQIESQYHEGEALPEADDLCFEAKELIVHPATVVILTKKKYLTKGAREQIHDEIEEVIEHIGGLVESI